VKAALIKFFSRQAAWLRRRAGLILLGVLLVGVVCFTLVLSFYMDIGFRREPDAMVDQAVSMAASCRELVEKRQAIRVLDELRTQTMMPPARARLLVALGDLHRGCFELDPNGSAAASHLERSARHYREARLLHGEREILAETQVALAHIESLRGNWHMARNILDHLLREDMEPSRKASLELLKCRNLIEMGETGEAYALLGENLGRYSAGPVHDQARIMAAELLIAEHRRRQGADGTFPVVGGSPENLRPGRLAELPGDLVLEQARDMLRTMLERLPDNDPRRMQVINGLLEVCLLAGDVETAYLHVRELEGLNGHRDQQIRSFDLLATLEQSQGNLDDAENAMRFCIRHFPEHEHSHAMRLRLYHLLREQERTGDAIEVFAALARNAQSRVWVERLCGEMLPENPRAIYHAVADETERKGVLAALRRLVQTLHSRIQPRWMMVQDRLLYLQAALAELAEDGEGIEGGVAAYLAKAPFGDYLDEILRMDAVCAEALRRSPAVRASRAHRYLARFPEGRHSESMLAIVLRAYYEMGLFRENLAVAEAAFVHAMVQDAGQADQGLRRPVVETMRWIAQCNTRLGRFEVAAALFNRCAQRLDLLSPDADFYRDWAQAALVAGQLREAVRRYEVGVRRVPAGKERERLMDQMLAVRYRAQGAAVIPAIERRLDDMRRNETTAGAGLSPDLYELLFDHVLAYEPERMADLLAAVRDRAPEALWPSRWAMRYLQRRMQEGDGESGRPYVNEFRTIYGRLPEAADRTGNAAACLRYLDMLSDLEQRIGELHERGL